MADYIAEAAKYFGKKKARKDPTINKMEEAAGIAPTPAPPPNEGKTSPTEPVGMERSYKGPYAKGETIKSGEKAKLWEGPKPWRKK